jgi:hypothetical protein
MRDMKETALQYTTFGYTQLHHTDVITVVMVPFALEVAAEILDEEIEHYEINIEDGAGTDTLSDLAALKGAQYKLMRGHKFGHAPAFTRVELVVMDDALTQWIEMNEENEEPSKEAYYACIAWNKITKALQKMG